MRGIRGGWDGEGAWKSKRFKVFDVLPGALGAGCLATKRAR